MPPRQPKKPEQRPDPSQEQTLETVTGVKIVVKPPPPPPPPEPEPVSPWGGPKQAIIVPAGQSLAAWMHGVYDEHSAFVVETLLRRWKLQPASAEDMRQNVMVILLTQCKTKEPPANVRGFLQGVMWKEVLRRHRVRKRQPLALDEGDAAAVVAPEMDPERAVALAEHRAKIRQYVGRLPDNLAEVVQLLDLEGYGIDDVAEALDLPRGTVSSMHIRARKEMREFAQASERGTKLGRRYGGA